MGWVMGVRDKERKGRERRKKKKQSGMFLYGADGGEETQRPCWPFPQAAAALHRLVYSSHADWSELRVTHPAETDRLPDRIVLPGVRRAGLRRRNC